MEHQIYRLLYEVENVHWWFATRKDILLRYLDARLPLPPTARVLDVGCGTGAILESLTKRYLAFGSDVAPQAIDFCRERGLRRLHLGTLQDYPPSEPFDLITMLDMVEHVDDDEALLRAAHGLLREGGHILITVPAFPSLWSVHDEVLHHKRRYTRRSLRTCVQRSGFVVEHLTFLNFFLLPAAWLKRGAARLTRSPRVNDLELPSPAVNAMLRSVFTLERHILPHGSLPVGLSLLCLARKGSEQ